MQHPRSGLWAHGIALALAACWVLLSACAAAPPPTDEAAIMIELRQALCSSWAMEGQEAPRGWHMADPRDACKWEGVKCDLEGRVRTIKVLASVTSKRGFGRGDACGPAARGTAGGGGGGTSAGPWTLALPASLARLQHLEVLSLSYNTQQLLGGIPHEFGQPGAFPRLKKLELSFSRVAASWPAEHVLPPIHPGALPLLREMDLHIPARLTLPASWGASPDVLPALVRLQVGVHSLVGQLPAVWSSGFRQLRELLLEGLPANPASWGRCPARAGRSRLAAAAGAAGAAGAAAGAAAGGAPQGHQTAVDQEAPPPAQDPPLPSLPGSWADAASGAFARLEILHIDSLDVSGPLLRSWQEDGFPALEHMSLLCNELSGTLSPLLFVRHPNLTRVELPFNRISGSLPPEWGSSAKALLHLDLDDNDLAGPAFPRAWLQPGSLPSLDRLRLAGNAELEGTLPASLPWPRLAGLMLGGTAVQGSVPAQWCQQPWAGDMVILTLPRWVATGPSLPSCMATAMPKLLLNDVAGSAAAAAAAEGGGAGRNQSVSAALAVAAAAAAAPAAALLWRRRRRRAAARQRLEQDMQRLVRLEERRPLMRNAATANARSPSSSGAGRGGGGLPLTSAAAAALPPQQQQPGPRNRSPVGATPAVASVGARLAALLRAELDSRAMGGGSGGGQARIELTRIKVVPAALAHHLGSARRRGTPSAAAGTGAAAVLGSTRASSGVGIRRWLTGGAAAGAAPPSSAVPSGHAGGWDSLAPLSSHGRSPAAGRGDSSGGGSGSEGEGDEEQGSVQQQQQQQGAPASRQWRLQTDSLQLSAGDLEFATDPITGALVELGEGARGAVFAAKLRDKLVAAKVFELEPGLNSGAVWHEVTLLRRCAHPRIVPLHGVAITGQLLVLAMQLYEGGSLRDALQDQQRRLELAWGEQGRQVAADVAEALDHLHSQMNVMHSDIKSANVLLSADYRAALADLDVAQVMRGTSIAGLACTSVYGAPEQLMGKRCTLAADIYSMGILLAEIATQTLVERRGSWRLPRAPEQCPAGVVAMIEECVSPDPRQRPTAAQLRQRLLEAG